MGRKGEAISVVAVKLNADTLIIPHAFCLERVAIKIKKQIAFPATTNAGNNLNKPIMPDRHELIYIKIAFYSHFQTFVLHFGFNLPFHKTTVLYHNALAPATTRIVPHKFIFPPNQAKEIFARQANNLPFSARGMIYYPA